MTHFSAGLSGMAGRLELASRPRALRVLVWQWGRRGAGPRFAAALAAGLAQVPQTEPLLSLSRGAEILTGPDVPPCDLPVTTYGSLTGAARRVLTAPVLAAGLWRSLRRRRPDVAICAMAGPLDLVMAGVLALLRVPFALIVHEVTAHAGDRWQVQYRLQRLLAARADILVALSRHVAAQLAADPGTAGTPVIVAEHPPFSLGDPTRAPRAEGGPLRLLLFGRLLPYKGLDLLADALTRLGARDGLRVRVVGQGPQTPALDRLRALPHVTVENRWVPETELAALFAWSDAVVLAHREASQSGVAAAALGAGRWVVATRVGGLPEQLAGVPHVWLCAPEPAALARAIAEAMACPAGSRDVTRQAARWALLGQRIVDVLEKQLSGSATGRHSRRSTEDPGLVPVRIKTDSQKGQGLCPWTASLE